jgi:NAD(P)-dependent dehydrogenase (short-subunit alcohol dehydrogenase family)
MSPTPPKPYYPSSQRFNGAIAIVTGAGRGIGSASARMLMDRGATVIRWDVSFGSDSDGSLCRMVDLASDDAIDEALDWTRSTVGAPDIFVHCAGVSDVGPSTSLDRDRIRRMQAIHSEAGFIVAVKLLDGMRHKGYGRIVFIGSLVADRSSAGHAHYGAAKAALTSFARSLATEIQEPNITCNVVAPGLIDTRNEALLARIKSNPNHLQELGSKIPLGRVGEANDIAEVVCFLASSAAAYIQGSTIVVDGGLGLSVK